MGDQLIVRTSPRAALMWGVLRRALLIPSVLAFATFITAFYLPDTWLEATSWHLYLDRLHPLFTAPASLGARSAFGAAAALITILFCLFIIFLVPSRSQTEQDEAMYADASPWRFTPAGHSPFDDVPTESADSPTPALVTETVATDEELPTRNRWDLHPDDEPRPPISAERELPAGGLGPLPSDILSSPLTLDESASEPGIATEPAPEWDDKPAAHSDANTAEDEPWLQSVGSTGPAIPASNDLSLAAMVTRLEARLARRRRLHMSSLTANAPPIPMPEPQPMTVADHNVDVALQAALGTLQRMNLRAVG